MNIIPFDFSDQIYFMLTPEAYPVTTYSGCNILGLQYPTWTESGLFDYILGSYLLAIISPNGSNELYDTMYTLENPWLGSH